MKLSKRDAFRNLNYYLSDDPSDINFYILKSDHKSESIIEDQVLVMKDPADIADQPRSPA